MRMKNICAFGCLFFSTISVPYFRNLSINYQFSDGRVPKDGENEERKYLLNPHEKQNSEV